MGEFTQFVSPEPVVIPAKEEIIYDKYWLELLLVRAPSPKSDATLTAKFRLYNDVIREFAPNSESISIEVGEVFAKAYQDLGFAQAMEMVFRALKKELDIKLTPTTTTTTTTELIEETTTTTTSVVTEEETTTTTTEVI